MKFFSRVKNFFKFDSTTIDNTVFKLHYRATFIILIACCILVTARQFLGVAISCISKDDIPSRLLDTFCWVHATFSIVDSWEKIVGQEIPYPGVDKYNPNETKIYHLYYQWVSLALLIQGILFYIPRCFWRSMEGGRVKNLILGLNSATLPEDEKASNRKILIDYLVSNKNNQQFYFINCVIAEVMNLVNVVGQILFMNAFLNGEFLLYGIRLMEFSGWESSIQYDPMIKVFPRMAKCTFYRYGSSGDVQRHDAMCILPMNILNEKIYAFLWFWFVILTVLSFLVLVYRAVTVASAKSRLMVTRWHARLADEDHLEAIISKCKLGDWLMLDLLCKNLDSLNAKDLINDYAGRLGSRSVNDNI